MGLDMYLSKKVYIGGQWEHREVTGKADIKYKGGEYHFDAKDIDEISFHVTSWRKANAVHGWFVTNCQEGIDDCRHAYVSPRQLVELRDLCIKVKETRDHTLLPPVEGFFFGSCDPDTSDWYWQDIDDTIKALENLDDMHEYSYHSSW